MKGGGKLRSTFDILLTYLEDQYRGVFRLGAVGPIAPTVFENVQNAPMILEKKNWYL